MTKTLFVGDMHLLQPIILPTVQKLVDTGEYSHIIFTGDYFDQWGQTDNIALYRVAMNNMLKFHTKLQQQNIKTTWLLGNHDIPYLTRDPKRYSCADTNTRDWLRSKLLQLHPQIAIQTGRYLVSHGGLTSDYELATWHLTPITKLTPVLTKRLADLESQIGRKRGGKHETGSMVWCDYKELLRRKNHEHPYQIVGHTPLFDQHIDTDGKLINIDSFSLTTGLVTMAYGEMLTLEDDSINDSKPRFDTVSVPHWYQSSMPFMLCNTNFAKY